MNTKVVLHIDEMSKWSLLLKNVRNLIKAVEPNTAQIVVLANSEAVKFFLAAANLDNAVQMRVISEKGVRFVACNNALNELEIAKALLVSFVEIVPTGILELIQLQLNGFAYIKP